MKRTIEKFAGYKRKYDELRDQLEREARQRAAAKRVTDMFGREERPRRRDGPGELESEIDRKNQDPVRGGKLTAKATDGGEEAGAVYAMSILSR